MAEDYESAKKRFKNLQRLHQDACDRGMFELACAYGVEMVPAALSMLAHRTNAIRRRFEGGRDG